jgi:hypothetical protein
MLARMKEKPDFIVSMLAGMVGIPPEEFQQTVEQFIAVGQKLGGQMNRVEYNLLQLIDAENDKRRKAKLPYLAHYDAEGNFKVGE